MSGKNLIPFMPHRVENDIADKFRNHFGHILQLGRHQLSGRGGLDHQHRNQRHDNPHHDDGFIDGNIKAAE